MAMLRLRIRSLLSAVHARAPSSLHPFHLLSTATAPLVRFVAEDFLVTSCGLAPALALRASRHIAHLKCSSNPEVVIAFFADSGLTKPEVAAAIAREPRLLCCKVEKTLRPRLAQLRDIGLSPPQISSLIAIAPNVFQSRFMVRHLAFYLSFLGSYDKVYSALRKTPFLLARDPECVVVKPNMAFLLQCGLTHSDIAKFTFLILLEPGRLKEVVARADKLGVPRYSAMFKHALRAINDIKPERIDAKLDFLKKVLGCSDNELGIAVRKLTKILRPRLERRLSVGILKEIDSYSLLMSSSVWNGEKQTAHSRGKDWFAHRNAGNKTSGSSSCSRGSPRQISVVARLRRERVQASTVELRRGGALVRSRHGAMALHRQAKRTINLKE